jgi:N-acetylglucosaminyl-diphospho-decaprenol L-rhamnosyltransferase
MTRSALQRAKEHVRPMVLPEVAVIIVGYRNAADIVGCLRALSQTNGGPGFHVFIAENGGSDGLDALRDALMGPQSPCRHLRHGGNATHPLPIPEAMVFSLPRAAGDEALVHIALMPENLGYAGGINAWLRPLLNSPGWHAAWILNPDTEPTPTSLFELVDYAEKHQKSMVASRIVSTSMPDDAHLCGLRWHKLTSRTVSVNHPATAIFFGAPSGVEALMDAPDGASIYVTRRLIERIGLMDERYFLYYEDLEWGSRAKVLGELGYAHRSRVLHKGGTTIGSSSTRATRSPLAVYMEFRNRMLFVRGRHPAWLTWAILVQLAHIGTYLLAGSLTNMMAASRGLQAGLQGESGKPVDFLRSLEAPTARPVRSADFPKFMRRALVSMISPRPAAQ